MMDFEIGLKEVGRTIKKRLKRDLDSFIVISGKSGYGKSALSDHLARSADNKYRKEKNMVFAPDVEQIMKTFDEVPKYSGIILDEAIKILFSQEWQSQKQRLMKKFYDVNRFRNKYTILNIPSFKSLNAKFRNEKVQIWIHVYSRGRAIVNYPSENPYKLDVWDFQKNERMFDEMDKNKNIVEDWTSFLRKVSQTKTFAFSFDFPDFREEDKPFFSAMKDKYEKFDLLFDDEAESKEERYLRQRNRLAKGLSLIGYTHTDIAKMLELKKSTISHGLINLKDDEVKLVNDIVMSKFKIILSKQRVWT